MDTKTLENDWKKVVQRYKVKDNGLQRSLVSYGKIEPKQFDARLKAAASINQIAIGLQRNYEKNFPDVADYLDDVTDAAQEEIRQLNKDKAAAKAIALVQKKEEEAQSKKEQIEEEREDAYHIKLLAALNKLKSSKGLSYEYIVCDAKPFCAVTVARQIAARDKDVLTKITGGCKRFLHVGTCSFEDGKFLFATDQSVSGLARRLQLSIQHFTGKKLPIVVGEESAGEDG